MHGYFSVAYKRCGSSRRQVKSVGEIGKTINSQINSHCCKNEA